MEVIALKCSMNSFFQNFSNVQCSLNLFEGNSIQAKMSRSKFKLSAEKKKLVIRRTGEGYRLRKRKQKSKNMMSGDCRTFKYWIDLCLKYLKERKNSSKEI